MADIQVIDSSLQFVSELLRNMLDLSREEQVKINMAPTDLLKDTFEPIASILFMRGAQVDIQVDCPNHLIIQADRMRLKQIILNLAGNSTKFVQQGYIRLRAEVRDECDNNSMEKDQNHEKKTKKGVYLHVEDSGPGIPVEKRNRMFAKFQESLDVLNQGTGIGLALCRNLSEMMGGELYLDDSFDSGISGCLGTRFTLRLNQSPLQFEAEWDARNNAAAPGVGLNVPLENSAIVGGVGLTELPEFMSVLFVDDDMIIRKMFSRSLRRVAPAWQVKEACNGETALRLVEEETFDLIFMDYYMASVEKQLLGSETVRLLRAKGVRSIICGLSANGKEQEFLDAGANGFMMKPFPAKKDELKLELEKLLCVASASPNDGGGSPKYSMEREQYMNNV